MSTKNLARTAIEGGRANTDDRNASHRDERARARTWLDRVRFDAELADATLPQRRPAVRKEFSDKLRPCWGWLASRAGRPWDDVYGELTSRFDTRKLSNKHIVFDHMLAEVAGAGSVAAGGAPTWWRATRFYVDDSGILRIRDRAAAAAAADAARAAAEARLRASPAHAAAEAYAAGRRVRDDGFSYWCTRGPAVWTACRWCAARQAPHRRVETTPEHLIERYTRTGFKALGVGDWWRTYQPEHFVPSWKCTPFSRADKVWWKALPETIRYRFTVYGGPWV